MNQLFYSVPQTLYGHKKYCGPSTNQRSQSHRPKWNLQESENGYSLEVALPGFDKNEVSLKFEDGVLTINAHSDNQPGEIHYIGREFSKRDKKLQLKFSEEINSDKIEAKFEQGILFIHLAKKEFEKSNIEVK